MAGYADIDEAAPLGTDAVAVAAEFRDLKADLLDGVGVEHDDGQTTAAHQGYHAFPAGNAAALPASGNRPDGHVFYQNDIADTLIPRRNNAGAVAYSQVGVAYLTKLNTSSVVNATSTSTITIQAWAAGHVSYEISAYTNGGTTPTVIYGWDSGGTDIYVSIKRVKGGNDSLVIHNATASPETVFYRVRVVVG